MVSNNKFSRVVKKLLITTAISSIAVSSNNVFASRRTSQNATSTFSVGADWDGGTPIVENDSIIFGGDHTIIANQNSRIITAVDTAGVGANGTLQINSSVTVGSIGGAGASISAVTTSDPLILFSATGDGVIAANDYSKLAKLDIGTLSVFSEVFFQGSNYTLPTNFIATASNGGGVLVIQGDNITLTGTFDQTAANRIHSVVARGNGIVFDNASPIFASEFIVNLSTSTTKVDVKALNFIRIIGGDLTVGDGKTLDTPSLEGESNGKPLTLTFNGAATLKADFGNFAETMQLGNGEVDFQGSNYVVTNTRAGHANSALLFSKVAPLTLNSIFSSSAGKDAGHIKLISQSDVNFTGSFDNSAGALINDITIGDKTKLIADGNINIANNITLNTSKGPDAWGQIEMKANKNITANDISATEANFGEIVFKGATTVNAKLGNSNSLNFIEIGAGKVSFNSGVIKAGELRLTNAAAEFDIAAANPVINIGAIKTTVNNQGKITVSKDATISDNIGANGAALAAIEIGAAELKLGNNTIFADEIRLTDPGGGSIFYFPATATLNVTAFKNTSGTDKQGKILISNNVTINDNIGANGAALEAIEIGDGELILDSNTIYADKIRFTHADAIFNFLGAATLNITAITAGASGQGTIKVGSNLTLDKNIGANGTPIGVIEVGAATLAFDKSNVYANEIRLADANAIFNVSGAATLNITTIKNTSGTNNQGKVRISGNSKIETAIGENTLTGRLEAIELEAGTLDFAGGDIYVQNIDFKQGTTLKLSTAATIRLRGNIKNISGTPNAGNVEIDTNVIIPINNGGFAAANTGDDRLNNINFLSDKKFTIQTSSPKVFVNSITTETANTGELIFDDPEAPTDKELFAKIGTAGKPLKTLSFNKQLTLKSGSEIYVDTLSIPGTKDPGDDPVAGVLVIEDNVVIGSKITTSDPHGQNATGTVNVQGSITFPNGIGEDVAGKRMQAVNFTPPVTKTINVTGDVFSDEITVTNPTLVIGNNTNISGQNNVNVTNSTVTFNTGSKISNNNGVTNILDSTLNINANNASFAGKTNIGGKTIFNFGTKKLNITNAPNSTFVGSPTFNLIINPAREIGQIVVDASTLDTTGIDDNTLTLTLADLTTSLPTGTILGIEGNAEQYFLFFTTNGGTVQILNDDKVLFDLAVAGNPFVTWPHRNGVLTQKTNPPADIDAALQAIIDANTPAGEPAPQVTENVNTLSPLIIDPESILGQDIITIAIVEPEELPGLISSFQPSTVGGPAIAENQSDTTEGQIRFLIGNRLITITEPAPPIIADNTTNDETGLAAGDQHDDDHDYYDRKAEKHGIWTAPFVTSAKHKKKKFDSGYKLRGSGVNIGYDVMVNEDLTLGTSAGFVQNTIKHMDQNLGDVTKSDLYVFSLHGSYELGNNWFTQAIAAYSHGKTVNRELRVVPGGREVASAKYDTNNFSGELLIGYHFYPVGHLLSSTSFGVEYHHLGHIKYTETGTRAQNLSIKRKAENDVELILSQRISKEINYREFSLNPHIHGHVRYDLITKRGKLNIKLNDNNLNLASRTSEFERLHYNAGTGVTLKKDNIEFGVDYDMYLAKKYVAHNGTLRLKVNF